MTLEKPSKSPGLLRPVVMAAWRQSCCAANSFRSSVEGVEQRQRVFEMSSKYSISAASRIAGKGRATIRRHLKEGTLSSEVDHEGNKVIDASELLRVYGDDCDFGRDAGIKPRNESERSEKASTSGDAGDRHYEARIEQLQSTIDRLVTELDRAHERDRESQENYKQSLRLLEDHSAKATAGEGWKTAIAALEEKLANNQQELIQKSEQRLAELEEGYKRKLVRARQELEAERSKPVWKKLFGQ